MKVKFQVWWTVWLWGMAWPLGAQVAYPQGAVEVPVYPISRPAFSLPESLHYAFSWNGLRAAEGEINVSLDPENRSQVHFSAQSQTVGLARVLWKAQEGMETWSSRQTLKPANALIHSREPTLQFDRKIVFDYRAGTMTSWKLGQVEPRQKVLEFRNAFDPLSLLFVLRSLEWQPGMERRFEVVDGENRYLLVLQALAEEPVKVAAGTYPAVKLSPTLIPLPRRLQGETPRWFERLRVREAQRPQMIKTLEFWISQDPPHPLLRVRSEAWIGHVDMELTSQSEFSPGSGSPGEK